MEFSETSPPSDDRLRQLRQVVGSYPGVETPEERRACDESLRSYLADTVGAFLHQVNTVDAFLSRRGPVHLRDRFRIAEEQIELLLDRINSAPYSFAPFFTVHTLDQDIQTAIVQHDAALLEVALQVRDFLAPTLHDDTDYKALATAVENAHAALDREFEERLEFILECQN